MFAPRRCLFCDRGGLVTFRLWRLCLSCWVSLYQRINPSGCHPARVVELSGGPPQTTTGTPATNPQRVNRAGPQPARRLGDSPQGSSRLPSGQSAAPWPSPDDSGLTVAEPPSEAVSGFRRPSPDD